MMDSLIRQAWTAAFFAVMAVIPSTISDTVKAAALSRPDHTPLMLCKVLRRWRAEATLPTRQRGPSSQVLRSYIQTVRRAEPRELAAPGDDGAGAADHRPRLRNGPARPLRRAPAAERPEHAAFR